MNTEYFYFMGRRDVVRDKVHCGSKPGDWSTAEWNAYWDGVQDEADERMPDLHTLLAW